jgi:hypothetical protein
MRALMTRDIQGWDYGSRHIVYVSRCSIELRIFQKVNGSYETKQPFSSRRNRINSCALSSRKMLSR